MVNFANPSGSTTPSGSISPNAYNASFPASPQAHTAPPFSSPQSLSQLQSQAERDVDSAGASQPPQIIVIITRYDYFGNIKEATEQLAFPRSHFAGKTYAEIQEEISIHSGWSAYRKPGPLKATFSKAAYNEDKTPSRITSAFWEDLFPHVSALYVDFKA